MLIDGRSLPSGHQLAADVCIIGAGPAGITLARELMKTSRMSILLIDGGGVEFDAATQSLNEGTVVGQSYQGPAETRRRQFGGTVNQWNTLVDGEMGAKFVPLDAIDFEKRDWMPYSGWPFGRAELNPFYRAHEMCDLGPFDYEIDRSNAQYAPFKLDEKRVTSGIYRMAGPAIFTRNALADFTGAGNVTLCLNANATELVADENGSAVRQIRLAALNGIELRATARFFVIAGGAIENARLLLASTTSRAEGLGNGHGLVGRYLMDHPVYYFMDLVPDGPEILKSYGFYDIHSQQGGPVLGRLTLPPELLERERLLNFSMVIYPKAKGQASRGLEGLRAFRHSALYGLNRLRRLRAGADAIFGAGDIFGYAMGKFRGEKGPEVHRWSYDPAQFGRIGSFGPEFYMEQAPDPENRVALGTQRDRLGMRQVEIHWRWGADGPRTAQRAWEIVAEQLASANIGRLRRLRWPLLRGSTHHPTGTTRMHDDVTQGVVDRDCRVHGIGNLYAAGSSVFPTAGYANPMLTIIALSLRLADRVKTVAATNL